MTGIDVLNTAVGLMSLVLGGFAIWLGLHFYEKAKESEKQTSRSNGAAQLALR